MERKEINIDLLIWYRFREAVDEGVGFGYLGKEDQAERDGSAREYEER